MANLGVDFDKGRIQRPQERLVEVVKSDGLGINLRQSLGDEFVQVDFGDFTIEIGGKAGRKMREKLEEAGII